MISKHELPVFVINLAHASERRARMERLLAAQGLACTMLSAVDGRKLDSAQQAFWQADPLRARLNPGEIGCLLSHCAAWEQIAAQNCEIGVVLEDDLCLSEQFGDVLRALAARPGPPGFDLLRLETDRLPVYIRSQSQPLISGFGYHAMRRTRPARSGAYMISRFAAQSFLRAAPGLRHPVDAELFDARRSALSNAQACQLAPATAWQAELSPALLKTDPFLASTIQASGPRVDKLTGTHRERSAWPDQKLRKLLRPVKRFVLRIALAPLGWQFAHISTPPQETAP